MAKDVRREVTVTYRCDGCGREDIRTEEEYKETLPDGWGSIVWAEGVIPRLSEKRSEYSPYGYKPPRIECYQAVSDVPLRLIMCCDLCSKKLHTLFKTKETAKDPEPPPKRPWWAWLFS